MCGIAGLFDCESLGLIAANVLRRMNERLAHRGPNGDGFHIEPGVGLAHKRLAIIDLATGEQPIYNEDRSVAIVFNGEIYNYRDLTRELSALGHIFTTQTDTEAIVHAWEEWGPNCVQRLRGMFAFAIFDRNRQCLFLARDRLGIKPLYYATIGRYLAFASELKALLATGEIEKQLDLTAVDEYFSFGYVPDPKTIYRGVAKLPPAHHLLIRRGKPVPTPVEYWRPHFAEHAIGEQEAARELIERLSEAVRIRLMADVPLGAFLSGGVDSSGVVAMMAREMRSPVKTFAVRFTEDTDDDSTFAAAIAQRYGTEHHEQEADASVEKSLRQQAAMFDEPFADASSIPTYRISKFAASHVTVALSGDAGDEIFAGYRRYRAHNMANAVRQVIPAGVRRPLLGAMGRVYPKLDWAPQWLRAKYTFRELALDEVEGYYRLVAKIPDELRHRLYSPTMAASIAGTHPIDTIAAAMREAGCSDPLARAQYADLKTYLAGDILTKVDRASMAASLEVRVPILDHKFVEWAALLPHRLKLRNGVGKYILKRALEPYVPQDNLYRAKRGFAAPIDQAFRGESARYARSIILGEPMRDAGLFDMKMLARLVDSHASGRRNHGQAIWSLLMFASFLSEVHFADRGLQVA